VSKQAELNVSIHSGSFQRWVVSGDRLHCYRQPKIYIKKQERIHENTAQIPKMNKLARSRKGSRKKIQQAKFKRASWLPIATGSLMLDENCSQKVRKSRLTSSEDEIDGEFTAPIHCHSAFKNHHTDKGFSLR